MAKPRIEVYDVVDNIKKGEKQTRGWIRKHPWESIGIAAFLGAALAFLFRRRK